MTRRAPSLRSSLLLRLLWPLLLLWLAGGILLYQTVLHAVNAAYDRSLMASVLAISDRIVVAEGKIVVDLPYVALELLETDAQDRIYYQVTGDAGELLTGYPDLPAPPEYRPPGHPMAYDTTYHGEPIRTAAKAAYVGDPVNPRRVLVQVAETTLKRQSLMREILYGAVLSGGVLIVMAGLLVWFGVAKALLPLNNLRGELARRTPEDLTAMAVENVPREVTPLVDALNQLMARLRKAWEVQRRFIDDASHQLRTPLSVLRTQAEVALRQPTLEEMRSAIGELHRHTEAAGHLISQMLTLARAEPGTPTDAVREFTDLASLAREACAAQVPSALGCGIDLGYEGDAVAEIRGEEHLLKEMATNLVDNAIRYGHPGGRITVGVHGSEEGVVFSVEDDGPGIPPEQREKVFERFYRIPGSPGSGCGLGLSIVRKIAKAHGATLHLKDSPGDGGLRVEIRFAGAWRENA